MVDGEDTLVVIEDDHHISDLVAMYLRRDGFRVLQADDGETGLALVARECPKLVILDVGLPGELDGFDVCRRLRGDDFRAHRRPGATPRAGSVDGSGSALPPHSSTPFDPPRPPALASSAHEGSKGVPVLILSARDDEVDRVLGLELGADDYVTKPFSARELVARVHAILRRTEATSSATPPSVVTVGPIEVDTGRREVRKSGTVVPLATREFDLLAYLVGNLGLALSRRQLLNGVWGEDWYGDERTVDVHIRQLRKKLGEDLPLATVWGVGYRMG